MNMSISPSLISSEDVEGTDVYSSSSRDKIGTIHHLEIDKPSGRIGYAVMSFGGFLGLGSSHYRIPWNSLRYDTGLEGYVCGVTKEQLESAPSIEDEAFADRQWETRLHSHYGVPYYWDLGPRP